MDTRDEESRDGPASQGTPIEAVFSLNVNKLKPDPSPASLFHTVGSGYSETYNYNVGFGNGGNFGNKLNLASLTRVIDGQSYQMSYQYNGANQLTQMTYPSGRVINLGRDSRGRITSVGYYLSSVTYDGIGQMTGTTLGNGVTESYGYDGNRMQLTSQSNSCERGQA